MIQGTANLRASHGIVATDWDPPDAEVAQVSRQLIDETVAAWNAQHADLQRARSIAVALEQENAELRRRMGMHEDWQRQDLLGLWLGDGHRA